MHDNPRSSDEEQELAQTKRMHDEEAMRGGHESAREDDGEEDPQAEAED